VVFHVSLPQLPALQGDDEEYDDGGGAAEGVVLDAESKPLMVRTHDLRSNVDEDSSVGDASKDNQDNQPNNIMSTSAWGAIFWTPPHARTNAVADSKSRPLQVAGY
jgi:hypothetical protein